MCGRFEVNKAVVDKGVYQSQRVRFDSIQHQDQKPGQAVSCLHHHHGCTVQAEAYWGIKPAWAHHAIINAQSETAATKKTFSSAYALNRCVVPCSAWYEWSGEVGHKQKHRFAHSDEGVLFMAGILFHSKEGVYDLVTLTCEADVNCGIYHHRMPLLIEESKVSDWLSLPQSVHELSDFHDLHAIQIDPPI